MNLKLPRNGKVLFRARSTANSLRRNFRGERRGRHSAFFMVIHFFQYSRIAAVSVFFFLLLAQNSFALRIVSLMPSYTEILFAVDAGEDVVGVTNFCDYPKQVKTITKVGDYLNPSLEKIYSLKPDIVFLDSSNIVAKNLENLKIKTVKIKAEKNIEDIFETINIISTKAGKKRRGEKLILDLKKVLSSLKTSKNSKTVYIDVDSGLWTCGNESYISDAVEKAGGKNIFSYVPQNYFQASLENIVKENPEYVISVSGNINDFEKHLSVRQMKFYRENKKIILDRNIFSRPSPRIIYEIKAISEALK